jgi:hypothetical protein
MLGGVDRGSPKPLADDGIGSLLTDSGDQP